LVLLLTSIAALCQVFGGLPSPSDGAAKLAAGGGVIGWVVTWPFVTIGAAWLAALLAFGVLALSLFILTKTPPNRIGARLRELYAYLCGAELPEPAEKPARGKKGEAEPQTADFGTLSDLGLEPDNPESMPWWRRSKPKDESPAFDTPVVGRELETEVVDGASAFDVELLDDLARAEEAVRRFTGEVEPAATALRDDATPLPGFADSASERGA